MLSDENGAIYTPVSRANVLAVYCGWVEWFGTAVSALAFKSLRALCEQTVVLVDRHEQSAGAGRIAKLTRIDIGLEWIERKRHAAEIDADDGVRRLALGIGFL